MNSCIIPSHKVLFPLEDEKLSGSKLPMWNMSQRVHGIIPPREQLLRNEEVEIIFVTPSDLGFKKKVSYEEIYFRAEEYQCTYFAKKYIYDFCLRKEIIKIHSTIYIGIRPTEDRHGFDSILRTDFINEKNYLSALRTHLKVGIGLHDTLVFEMK